MPRRKSFHVSLLAGLFALLIGASALAACSSGDSNRLVVYSGRTRDLIEPLLENFAKDTGTKIDVRYGNSADLADRVVSEGEKSPAAVFLSQSPGAIGYLDSKHRLSKLPSSVLATVPARFRASDGSWVGLSGRVRTVVFDPKRTEESEVPPTVFDFTNPRFKGRVGIAPENASFQDFVTVMRSLEGDAATLAWLTAMRANRVHTYADNVAIRDAVQRGDIDFGLVNHYYNERAKAENPKTTTKNHFLGNNDAGSAILTTGVGVLDTAGNHAKDAERFVEYMLSKDAQEYFAEKTFEYPLAAGVKPAGDLPPLNALPSPRVDLSKLGGGLQRTRELIRQSGLQRA